MSGSLVLAALGCAHRVEPVVRPVVWPQPIEPMSARSVSVCWVEYARAGAFTASGLAVRHAAGVVLVDAGQSRRFVDEIREVPRPRLYLRLVPGKLVPDAPASEALAAAKVDPAEIVAFVPTHAHSDHLGGLMDLPDVAVRAHPAELALLEEVAAGRVAFNVLPAEARRIVPLTEPLGFVDQPYLVFSRHADLLGDGAVVVVPLEGHTPGSVGVVVDTSEVRLLYAGDAINTRAQLEHLRGKSALLRRTDADRAAADAQVGVLAGLHQADPELVVLPAHERRAWVDLFGAPGACVGGP